MAKLGDFANLFARKGQFTSRVERIKREGSPNYPYNLPATAAAAVVTLSIPTLFPLSRKYQPLDFLEIVNNEAANDLTVTINNADVFYCPSWTIRTIRGKGIALWQVAITNVGGVITTLGLVRLTLKKEAMTIDRWASEQ